MVLQHLERLNKEIGGVMVKIGGAINPFVDIDHREVNEAIEDPEIGLLGTNVISAQFDDTPGGGFADTTIGGAQDLAADVGTVFLGGGGQRNTGDRSKPPEEQGNLGLLIVAAGAVVSLIAMSAIFD